MSGIWDRLGTVWGPFGDRLGIVSATVCWPSGMVAKPFADRLAIVVKPFGDRLGIVSATVCWPSGHGCKTVCRPSSDRCKTVWRPSASSLEMGPARQER